MRTPHFIINNCAFENRVVDNLHSLKQDRLASLILGSLTRDHTSKRATMHQCFVGLCSQ